MTKHILPHHLRSARKRRGLSQCDVAALMGFPNSSKLSRIEVYAYEPHASATIALSIILDEPIEQLFDGIYRQALVTIREHARDLLREFDRCDTRPSAKQRKRLALIKDLAHSI